MKTKKEWNVKNGCRSNSEWGSGRMSVDGRGEDSGEAGGNGRKGFVRGTGSIRRGSRGRTGGCRWHPAGLVFAVGLVFMQGKPLELKAADYEARIGDDCYESLEEAFGHLQEGDTVYVLKDCSVSGTLSVKEKGIVLKSENAADPATVGRDADFTGKDYYLEGTGNILVGVDGGSLTMQDIILDGGAVPDGDFHNSGQTWDSPLVYVKGTYRMESGTVLQNNYNTDGNEDNSTARFAGAVQVMEGGTFDMRGGIIRNCYTNGSGGGVHARNGSSVSAESGNIWNCYGMTGGAMAFFGPAEISGMTLSGNCAKMGGAVEIHHEVRLSGCVLENNRALLRGGAVGISGNCPVMVENCSITGNSAAEGSAVSISDAGGNSRPVFRDCVITGNCVSGSYSGTVHYMGRAGMVLDGDIVVGNNTAAGGTGCDIFFRYADADPVSLGESFCSDSVFALGGDDGIVSGKLLIDASSQGKTADTEHFIWSRDGHYTEARGGDIYLMDAPEKYILFYDANNGGTDIYEDPGRYTSEDTAVAAGWQTVFSDENVKTGFTFDGWNTKADGTGTDYQEGQEIHLTDNLWLYAKWKEECRKVTVTFVYNGGSGEKAWEEASCGVPVVLPYAFRKGYRFRGWYEDGECRILAGMSGGSYIPERDMELYAGWEKEENTEDAGSVGGDGSGENDSGGDGNGTDHEDGGKTDDEESGSAGVSGDGGGSGSTDDGGEHEGGNTGEDSGVDNDGNAGEDGEGDDNGNAGEDGEGDDNGNGGEDSGVDGGGNAGEDSGADDDGNAGEGSEGNDNGNGSGDSGGNGGGDNGKGENGDSSAGNEGNACGAGSVDDEDDTRAGSGKAGRDKEDGEVNMQSGNTGGRAAVWKEDTRDKGEKEPVVQAGRFPYGKIFFLTALGGMVFCFVFRRRIKKEEAVGKD